MFLRSLLVPALCSLATWLATASPLLAERPVAPRLLPESTLAFARIADMPQLVERFRETALGRISSDEEVAPLVQQLYGSAQGAWTQIEDQVGLPLAELLQIPQGEVCIAFVAIPEQRPGVVLIIDTKDQVEKARKLLARGEEIVAENGGYKETVEVEGHQVDAFNGPDGNAVYKIEREGTVVIATEKPLIGSILTAWDGSADKTLADNPKFTSIMSRCAGMVDDPPQITWFIDPVEIFRTVARGNIAGTTLALLPVLGLDGVHGIGGSFTFASGDFDDVQHVHLLLENPRSGVVQLLAMKSADTTPEPWVPANVVSYITINWDFQQTFDKAAILYNSLLEEGALQAEVQRRISEQLGADFETEVLPNLEGRVTLANWVERPVKINTMASLIGVRLKDPSSFQPVLDKILEKLGERVEKKAFANVVYWSITPPERELPNLTDIDREALRQPDPCMAIVGDYLIITDRSTALIEAIKTAGDPSLGLAGELEFKLVASKIKRQIGGDTPGMLQFSRPEEGLRFWYDLATATDTQDRMARRAENSRVFADLSQAMKDNPLPPFSVLAKYVAPGGGMIVNDETGFHYMSFTLRRKQ